MLLPQLAVCRSFSNFWFSYYLFEIIDNHWPRCCVAVKNPSQITDVILICQQPKTDK